MISKQKTIWKFGILFGDSEYSFDQVGVEQKSIVYQGELETLPKEIAQEVAEIHPDFEKYNESAMATLYKTYDKGRGRGGSEDPMFAIETLKSGKENEIDLPYILIWRIC